MSNLITNFHKVQIRTRGIIPVIMKRGPLAEIELDEATILELVVRGVDIVSIPDGAPITLSYFSNVAQEPRDTNQISHRKGFLAPHVVEKAEKPTPVTVPEPIAVNVPVVEEVVVDAATSTDFNDACVDAAHALVQSEAVKADAEIASGDTTQQPMSKNQMKKARRAAAQAAQGTQNQTTS